MRRPVGDSPNVVQIAPGQGIMITPTEPPTNVYQLHHSNPPHATNAAAIIAKSTKQRCDSQALILLAPLSGTFVGRGAFVALLAVEFIADV